MFYKRSYALQKYRGRQREVFGLLKVSRKAYPEVTLRNLSALKPIYRGAIVLLYSHLEGYIEDVIEESVEYLNRACIKSNQLPGRLKIANCEKVIAEISATTDPVKKEQLIEALIINNYPFWSDGELPPAKLEADFLTSDFANPSPRKIEKLLKKMGIEKIFSEMFNLGFNKRRVGTLSTKIEALAEIRHDIAHGNFATACTDDDLIDYLKSVKLFCRCLDAKIGLHLEEITKEFPWKN
ncbi:MAE_28990/MAE_18760 family HEPN-like nuclease [Azotosporobacter soli]|uniref:MAE_28990/MAE_18760 family HEPN-like nuclease n=1 Tax=Azotosporobacter soli TaxID=3055040 RepID=UPI0031FF0097